MEQLDDRDLFQLILVNKYAYSLADENFWRNRLMSKYPGSVEYKKGNWKAYYLSVVYYVDLMKRDYNYSYVKGDPKEIYNIFKNINFRYARKYIYRSRLEDPALFIVNNIRREYGYPELNPLEAENYIKNAFRNR